MTSQMQGEVLYEGWSGTNPEDWVYTPWMPVRADYATFGVQVTANEGGYTLGWEVQTRTAESPTATTIVPTQSMSAAGVGQYANQGEYKCLQMFRYRFKLPGTASTTNCVVFRALMPSWQTDR